VALSIVFLWVLNAGYGKLFVKASAVNSFVPHRISLLSLPPRAPVERDDVVYWETNRKIINDLQYIVFAHINTS